MASTDSAKPHLIFTYGTLKQGFPNHTLMQDLITKGDAVLEGNYFTHQPHPLVCGPYGIPYLINLPGSGHRVKGELYKVSARGLVVLDELEGISIGHYERLPVHVANGAVPVEAEAYFVHRKFGEELWRKKGEVGLCEYTEKDARNYVRKEHRGSGRSMFDEVGEFVSSAAN